MVDVRKIANIVLQILSEMSHDDQKISNAGLLKLLKDRTGDNTLTPYDLNDIVHFLDLQGAVILEKSVGIAPFNFNFVKISVLGRREHTNALQT